MKYLNFYGNLYNCPWSCRLNTCPLYSINSLTFEEKFNWFENLTKDEKEIIVEHHSRCSKKRAFQRVLV